jgi:uncharacterized phiE125 gp8 family phage protein
VGLRIIQPPAAVEPVTVEEVKQRLRVDHVTDDAVLAGQITEAREWIERRIEKKIAQERWEFVIDAFPAAEIRLPFGPVRSVVHIKYDDPVGDEQTVPTEDYALDNTSDVPWVFSLTGSWPTPMDAYNAVRIQFDAGPATGELATPLRAALYEKLKTLYDGEDREAVIHNLLTNYYRMVA